MRLRALRAAVTLAALLLIAAAAPLDNISRETVSFVDLPTIAVILGFLCRSHDPMSHLGSNPTPNSVAESLVQSLEMRLKLVEERFNQLDRDLYAHGHTYKCFGGEASDVEGHHRELRKRIRYLYHQLSFISLQGGGERYIASSAEN